MNNLKTCFTKSTVIISLITLTLGFVGGFFTFKIGNKSSLSNRNPNGIAQTMGNRTMGADKQGGNRNINTQTTNSKQTVGEITKIDNSSITIKTPDGSSKIVLISDSIAINKATVGTKADLVVGANVSITGDSNSDGSITCKNLNINSEIIRDVSSQSPQTLK